MENTPTCMDCSMEVPKMVRFFDKIPKCNGISVYNYFTKKQWIKTGNDYICPDCLVKRQKKERMEERKKQEEAEKSKQQQRKKQETREHQRKEREKEVRHRKEQKIREKHGKDQERQEQPKNEQDRTEKLKRKQKIRKKELKEQDRQKQDMQEQQRKMKKRRKQQSKGKYMKEQQAEEKEMKYQLRKEIEMRKLNKKDQERQEQRKNEQNRTEKLKRKQEIRKKELKEQDRQKQDMREQQRKMKKRRKQPSKGKYMKEQQAEEKEMKYQLRKEIEMRKLNKKDQERQEQCKNEQGRTEKLKWEQELREKELKEQDSQKQDMREQQRKMKKRRKQQSKRKCMNEQQAEEKYMKYQPRKEIEMRKQNRKEQELREQHSKERQALFRPSFDHSIDVPHDCCVIERSNPESYRLADTSFYDNTPRISFNQAIKNREIKPLDLYKFLCDKPAGKHLDVSKDILSETCTSILSLLRNKHTKLQRDVTNVAQEVETISLSSFNDSCMISLVLLCVYYEQWNIKTEMHTFHILNQYCCKQDIYKDDTLSIQILLRKFCDVLSLLQTDTLLSKVGTNIDGIFNRLYSILVDACFKNDYIKLSLDLIKTRPTWDFDDLVCLLWFVYSDCNQGKKVLHLICTFALTPNEILSNKKTIKEMLLKWNSEGIITMLNPLCKTVSEKTFSSVLVEMEKSRHIDSQLKCEIHNILDQVYKQLDRYGRFDALHHYWNGSAQKMRTLLQMRQITNISDKKLAICVADICRCVKVSQDYWPRCTQIISLCMLIKSYKNGYLLEINTGEGKTCIIAMFAAFLAVTGKSVDIISSSPLLAERDSEEWSNFFKKLNVSVSSNLTQKESSERRQCYQKAVVYGTIGSFASDILRQEFLMENVRGSRRFDVVIVDEIDCLLLDQGMNCTYLSSASPGMHHLEPILLMIWNEVIRHPIIRSDRSQQYFLGKAEPFHVFLSSVIDIPAGSEFDVNLQILYLLEMAEILPNTFTSRFIDNNIDSTRNSIYRKTLTKVKMLECFQWIQSNFDISFEIYEIFDASTIKIVTRAEQKTPFQTIKVLIVGEGLVCGLYKEKETLCTLIQSKIEGFVINNRIRESSEPSYSLPTYLLEFVKSRLSTWINNAFNALYMTAGREYLIKDENIVPVDFQSTGVLELDTKWGDGLHQFLEIKHKKVLSQMTIVTNFMSNQAFFKRYPHKIFGVSGTLGSPFELSYLDRTFGLKYSQIPTIRRKKHSEIPGVVCCCKTEWMEIIQTTVGEQLSKKSYRERRAVLVVCEDINATKEIKTCLKSTNYKTLLSFTGNDTDDLIENKKLFGGDVVVATNIAGRGTDIEIDDSVVDAGGLFVLVTFLPQNKRVENQVFGRSARKGHCGSSQIILNKEFLPPYLQFYSDIFTIKKARDEIEQKRLKEIERNLLLDLSQKEELFSIYCQHVKDESCLLDEIQRKIMLNSMHEFWGLWLKMNSDHNGKQNFDDIKKI